MNKVEAASIRAQLKLRYNHDLKIYQVYTTVHGSGVFRWYNINRKEAEWYCENFNLTIEEYSNEHEHEHAKQQR